ncbi:hypothetical protein Tco_0218177 [Tanacetum coccineum]
MSGMSTSLWLLSLMFFIIMVSFAESRNMATSKSSYVSKSDELKPVPTLEFTNFMSPSKPSRNDHQAHDDEVYHFANNVESYKAASTGPSQKGGGHK